MGAVDQEGVGRPAADNAPRILHHVTDLFADFAKHLVTVGLSVALIDHVEVVDIQHDGIGGQIFMIAIILLGVAVEELPVIKAGQLVTLRLADDIPVLRELNRPADADANHLRLRIGLGNKVHRTFFNAFHLRLSLRRHDNDRDLGSSRVSLQLPQDIHALHVRQIQIQQNQAEGLVL